jgi:glycosyltransferase involved in cell wall biosynthesis
MINPDHPDYSNTPASASRPPMNYSPVDPQKQPCISIVTPFYNGGEVFHETALSVMRQSMQQWEWIIVNDGSSDLPSLGVLQKYRHGEPRIRIIDHPRNQGPSAARNAGFQEARSDIVVLLDSDDLLEPTALEKWAWYLESHPECAFVSGYSVGFGATQYLWTDGFHSGREILNKNTVRITAAIRKSVHAAVGGLREDLRNGLEDWEFWLRCAEKGYWGDTLPEYLDWYRRRKDHSDRWENYGLNERYTLACAEMQAKYAHVADSFPTLARNPLEIYPQIPEDIPFNNPVNKKKRRLLMLLPWMTMGGADKFNLDLVSQLVQRDWEITIVATLPGDNCWCPQFAQKTPDIFILDHFLTLTDWPRFICYLMASRQIDHVWISNSDFGYSVLPYLKQKFPKAVFTDFCHMEEEYWKGGGYPRKAVESQPLLDMNIVSSEHLKEWMVQRGAKSDRISVCYTNIDSNAWQPQPQTKVEIRRELGIGDNTPIILYAGRIHAQKQPRVFAETVLHLKNYDVPFSVVVAGDGPESPWLRNFLIEHRLQSFVKLLGRIPNERMKRLLQGSDIFFLPSMMEGISLAIYEAMACGVAVVGADVGGQKELLTPACGYLIPRDSESVEARTYASIISSLLRNPAKLQSMGDAGRRRITNGFELHDMGHRMHALFLAAEDRSQSHAQISVHPGLGRSLVSMAVDYHRIEKLLRDVWPFYSWTERNRGHLELLFPSDKIPPKPAYSRLGRARPSADQSTENGNASSLQLLEESIYNLFAHLPERVLEAYLGAGVPAQSALLEDVLTMRQRILPEIGRWQKQNLRLAIYGIGTYTQVLLGTLPMLMPLVQCFIDQRATGAYLGRPCIKPEATHQEDVDVVIYSSKRWESEMYQNLAHLRSIEHVLIYGTSPSNLFLSHSGQPPTLEAHLSA